MNSTFCTDLVSLFVNHLYDCDPCFDKFFGIILVLFIFIAFLTALISIFVCFFDKFFSKLFDRVRYKKLYDDLITKYGDLKQEFDELQKEYYHTCN